MKNFLRLLGILGVTYFAILLLAFVASNGKAKGDSARYNASNHDAGMACIMAEKLIRPQLKAPKSAEFDYADCKQSATRSGNTWTLRSYVDADNSFGAHIRTRYVAKLTNVPPSDTWRMVALSFDE